MVIQAKFRVSDPETFLRLQIVDTLAGFELSTCQSEQVFDTYMDTRGRRLLAAGYRFRRREQSDGVLMTLATLSKPVGPIHRWEKWEILLASDRSLAKWPESSVRSMMLQLIGNERLVPLVKLQQTRIIRCLFQGEQQVAEVRLDSVGYRNTTEHQVHFEMELELIEPAREEILVGIVDCLGKELNLRPEQLTKFEQVFAPVIETRGDPISQALFRLI